MKRILLLSTLMIVQLSYAQTWVTQVTPSAHSVDAAGTTDITISFTEDIDVSTLNDSSIAVFGSFTGRYTSNAISYEQRLATYRPAADFKPGEVITVTVTTDVRNSQTTQMPTPFSWQFTTGTGVITALFSVSQTVAVAGVPYSIAIGDLDNDGDLDLATANRSTGRATILNNNGSGNFQSGASLTTGSLPEHIITFDANGDGRLEIATVNAQSNSISIFTNQGQGNFSAAATISGLASPHGLNAGDLDGDGDFDLVASNFSGGRLSVFLNDGSGAFTAGTAPTTANGPEQAIIGDFDLDGDFDLAVPHFFANNVVVLENTGSASFSQSATLSTGNAPHLPTSGDYTQDGNLDILITNSSSNRLTLLANDGSGNFSQSQILSSGSPWSGATADLDGDGDLDLAVTKYQAGQLSILLNEGNDTFVTLPDIAVGIRPHLVVAADLDGDNIIDLAVTNEGGNSVSILKNTGPTSVETSQTPQDFTLKQNYPNPFNPSTTIRYSLKKADQVTLKILNIQGQEVLTLEKAFRPAGEHQVTWDGRDASGTLLPSGFYFYRLQAGTFEETRRMQLVK